MVVSYYCRWKGAEDVVLTFGMALLTDTQVYHLHGTYIYICTTLIILSINESVYYQRREDPIMGMETLLVSHIRDGRLVPH